MHKHKTCYVIYIEYMYMHTINNGTTGWGTRPVCARIQKETILSDHYTKEVNQAEKSVQMNVLIQISKTLSLMHAAICIKCGQLRDVEVWQPKFKEKAKEHTSRKSQTNCNGVSIQQQARISQFIMNITILQFSPNTRQDKMLKSFEILLLPKQGQIMIL